MKNAGINLERRFDDPNELLSGRWKLPQQFAQAKPQNNRRR
jgi:hypothetical protein